MDQKPGIAWVQTEIGPGKFGDTAVPGDAAWVRQPMYWDMNWSLQEPKGDESMGPRNDNSYTRSDLIDLGPLLGKPPTPVPSLGAVQIASPPATLISVLSPLVLG